MFTKTWNTAPSRNMEGILSMRHRKSAVRNKVHSMPVVRFEDGLSHLTSCSGLVLLQKFFTRLDFKRLLRVCFRGTSNSKKVFDHAIVFLQLIVHLLLGHRELRHCESYRDDPLAKRLGLQIFPGCSRPPWSCWRS